MNSAEGYKGFITFLILSGVVLTVLIGFRYINKPTSVETRASEPRNKATPQGVETFEITDSSAQIRWITEDKLAGAVIYSIGNALCGYEKTKTCPSVTEESASTAHYLTLNDLNPGTTYYYKIKFGNNWFPADEPYFFTTKDAHDAANTLSQPIVETLVEGESDGFFESYAIESEDNKNDDSGFYEPDSEGILGTQTKLLDELRSSEFKEAMEYKDMNYDFNKDGEVNNLDYPLLIEFITNQED